MGALLLAQFISAFADNALFVVAIALVKIRPGGEELIPMVQEAFVVAFIVLAPFVGPLADTFPKGRVMFLSNALKLVGAALMQLGLNPFLAYSLVGAGAATYSPAKYGILTQFFTAEKLVRANSMLEGSTIAAILLGVVCGGLLADKSLNLALMVIIGLYFAAALANLLIPRLAPEHPFDRFSPAALVVDFWNALKTLLCNPDARFSLLGTSLFWGSGSTLRLMLFAWVPVALAIQNNQIPANLMGAVSVGIVIGATLAGAFVTLKTVNRVLWGGVLLGPAVMFFALSHNLALSVILLIAIGMCGGLFVVPLNALLQERGHETVGAGHALAVQNFFENSTMLLFAMAYEASVERGVPVISATLAFGGLILLGAVALSALRFKSRLPVG
jgi:LPLT family lysophospholipid transporter-like MFS transporter